MDGQSDASILQPSPYPPNAFHRQLSQQQSQQQAQQLLRNSAKLSNPNSRGRIAAAAAGLAVATDDGTIDPKNFATIRTTSIVQRQQKEHLQEEMHEQMSGYKRLRRDHQAALAKLEEACRQEMEKHKQLLDKEYEQLLTQFSKELEKMQLKHQEELGKQLKMNINTEKKLIKEVSSSHDTERKTFEIKMKA